MRLYRVIWDSSNTRYVLADSFDAAVELVALEASKSRNNIPHNFANSVEDLGTPLERAPVVEVPAEPQQPAVSIKKSITPDYLICLDDGLRFKSLRRHLKALGMTPEQYRAKWGLPPDYPMVAASYSARRSEMAKSFGLGRK